jgi:hypothetical protein
LSKKYNTIVRAHPSPQQLAKTIEGYKHKTSEAFQIYEQLQNTFLEIEALLK